MDTMAASLSAGFDVNDFLTEDFLSLLPFDLLREILVKYVGPEGTAKLRGVEKSLYGLCSNDAVWRDFCCKELRVKPKDLDVPYKHRFFEDESPAPHMLASAAYKTELRQGTEISFYEAYSRLIYPFRGLLNWFLLSRAAAWDDILSITFQNGLIHGELWYLPSDITADMIPMSDFTIFIEEDSDEVVIRNDFIFSLLLQTDVPLKKLITTGTRIPGTRPTHAAFAFRQHRHHARRWVTIQEFILGRNISWPASGQNQRRFEGPLAYSKLEDLFDSTDVRVSGRQHSTRIFYPHRSLDAANDFHINVDNLPMGLYKGTFGAIGNQLVTVVWGRMPGVEVVTEFLTGFKTTGHPGRPAGTYLFTFKLRNSVVLQPEHDQGSIKFLEALENGPFCEVTPATRFDTAQPFKMPPGIRLAQNWDGAFVSDRCVARFVGRGAMAGLDDQSPKDVVAHLVVLNPSRFLVLWLGEVRVAVFFDKINRDDRFFNYI